MPYLDRLEARTHRSYWRRTTSLEVQGHTIVFINTCFTLASLCRFCCRINIESFNTIEIKLTLISVQERNYKLNIFRA